MPTPEAHPDRTGPVPTPNPAEAAPHLSTEFDPEATLVEAARAGDDAALRELLAPETDRLYAVCLGMLRDPDAARDAAQDALVRIIRGLESFDGRARFTTWTTRIALNICLTRIREARRHARLNARFPAPPAEPGADRRVEVDERARRAADALDTLSEEHRTVLVLRDLRGLDLDRIAETLGLPPGTVKSRLFRARAALRATLEADPDPDANA